MKLSQIKHIIKELIKEQSGTTAGGGPNNYPIHCMQSSNSAGCVTIFNAGTGPGSLEDYLAMNPGAESTGVYDDMASCQAACFPSTEPSSCCEHIQALKQFIPIANKQFYLDALEGCGCNQSSVSRRR